MPFKSISLTQIEHQCDACGALSAINPADVTIAWTDGLDRPHFSLPPCLSCGGVLFGEGQSATKDKPEEWGTDQHAAVNAVARLAHSVSAKYRADVTAERKAAIKAKALDPKKRRFAGEKFVAVGATPATFRTLKEELPVTLPREPQG